MRIPLAVRRLPRAILGILVLPVAASACSSASPASSASTSTSNSSNSSSSTTLKPTTTTLKPTTTTLKPTTGAGGTRPVGPTPPASETACALVSAADVNAIMGTTVSAPKAVVRGSVTTCTYRSATLSKSVIIEYDTAATAASFAAGRSEIGQHGGSTTAIGGLGNGTRAYSFTLNSSGAPVNTVVALQGTLQTIVSSTASAASVQNLSATVLRTFNAAGTGTTTTG